MRRVQTGLSGRGLGLLLLLHLSVEGAASGGAKGGWILNPELQHSLFLLGKIQTGSLLLPDRVSKLQGYGACSPQQEQRASPGSTVATVHSRAVVLTLPDVSRG